MKIHSLTELCIQFVEWATMDSIFRIPDSGNQIRGMSQILSLHKSVQGRFVHEVRNSWEDSELSCRHLNIRDNQAIKKKCTADSWKQWEWSLSELNLKTDLGITYKGKAEGTPRVMCKERRALGRGPHNCEQPVSRRCNVSVREGGL